MDFAHFTERQVDRDTEGVVVFDLDGVLADARHRAHLISGDEQNWGAFFAACADDTPIGGYVETVGGFATDHHVLILTSRPVAVHPQTVAWLRRHGVHWDTLVMRSAREEIRSAPYKKAVMVHLLQQGERIVAVFDDDLRNINEFVALGVNAVYVNSGYYTNAE